MDRKARWILVVSIIVLLGGFAWAGYQRYTTQATVRIAIGQHRADDALLINELGKWLTQNNRRTRVEVVTVPDDVAAVAAVRTGKAEMASVRGDQALPGGVNSALALYRAVAIVVALPKSGVQDWNQLNNKTIGLLGHLDPQDIMLQKILRARNVTGVKFVPVERGQLDEVLRKNSVHAIAQISPLNMNPASELRAGKAIRRIKGAPVMLELADAEALAESDNRYEDYDVPAGALKTSPSFPEEATSTLAVIRHLVVPGSVQAITIQKTLIDLMDAKRGIAQDFPLALQIGSPGVEKDAAIKIHPGALSYFNGEEIRLSDILLEWVYIVPMIIGGIGALATWLYNFFWPADARRAQDTLVELLLMRRDAARAQSLDDLDRLEQRRDEIQELIHDEFSNGELEDRVITALLVAAEATDRKIDYVRDRLMRATQIDGSIHMDTQAAMKTAAQ